MKKRKTEGDYYEDEDNQTVKRNDDGTEMEYHY